MKNLFKKYMPIDYSEMRSADFLSKMNESNVADINRVRNGKGFTKISCCDFCNSTNHEVYLLKNGIEILQCKKCNLVFSSEHPINFDDLYSPEEYLDYTIDAYEKNSKFRKERFGIERVNILKKYKKNGVLLDMGCGIGWFLEVASQSFDVCGVEISDSLREYIYKQKGIKSFKTIDDIENNTLDVITAFDLIEHVPKPLEMLKSMYDKLKKGGIGLLFTPNVDSVGFQILKEENNLLDPPGHLYYFNKDTIKMYAEKAGFKVEKIWTKGIDVGDLYSLELSKKETNIADYLYKNQYWIQDSIDRAGMGNHMRIILVKD